MNVMQSAPRSLSLKLVAAVVAVAVVAGAVGLLVWSNAAAAQAVLSYQQRRQALQAKLRTAGQQGYSQQDLQPISSQAHALDVSASQEPWWLPGRAGYFQQLASQAAALDTQLGVRERQLVDGARMDAAKQLDAAKAEVVQAQQAGAADSDVAALQLRVDTAAKAQGSAHTLADYRAVNQQGKDALAAATTLFTQVQQENQQVQQAAQQVLQENPGNLGGIQKAGNDAVATARNDASVAAYLNKPSAFKGWGAIQRAYNRLEKSAPLVGSGDINQSALGTAGAKFYAGAIHSELMSNLPSQVVVISFNDQHLWAYQDGKVALENAVTTGIRGVTDFGTDFGPMKVVRKNHPWTMHSPWPKGSQYYYPDTVVQWATFFTNTGESIHDAAWEPDSLLGPGSQYNLSTRSHGCVHLPASMAQWMYNWAQVDMPVIVYPGDGTTVANQLSLITTNDQGIPQSAG
jgi:lipoprotein-anchoring transpeptidase ErfK/SrfK